MDIKTERMFLRDFRETDAAGLHAILGDKEVMQYSEPVYSYEKTCKFLEEFCMGKHGAAAAILKGSDRLIGYLLFHFFNENACEIGWFFHKDVWRQGYAYEASKALVDYAFRERSVDRIVAETIDPVKSVGLMKKLGMRLEEIQRCGSKDNGEKGTDFYIYELRKEDWKAGDNG